MLSKLVVLSGGFDPVHEGHISMFRDAKEKYGYVVVGLNSDEWLTRKKGKPFMPFYTRKEIISSFKYVDEVVAFDDADNTAISLLKYCLNTYSNTAIVFGNGGDRSKANYPEHNFCITHNINTDDSLGGSYKANSSSWLLDSWKTETAIRDWGMWKVLFSYKPNYTKIKELIVEPGKYLSWQKHFNRSEIWFVRQGLATVHFSDLEDSNIQRKVLNTFDSFIIPAERWHRLSNESDKTLSIIEIQYGSDCSESDILRSAFLG